MDKEKKNELDRRNLLMQWKASLPSKDGVSVTTTGPVRVGIGVGDLDGDAVGGDEEVTYEVWSMKYSSLFVFPGGVTQISRRRPGIWELRERSDL